MGFYHTIGLGFGAGLSGSVSVGFYRGNIEGLSLNYNGDILIYGGSGTFSVQDSAGNFDLFTDDFQGGDISVGAGTPAAGAILLNNTTTYDFFK